MATEHRTGTLQQLLLNVASSLLGADDDSLEAEMARSLRLIGRQLDLDALSVCVHDGRSLSSLGQWRAQGGWLPPPFELDLERASWLRPLLAEPRELLLDDLDAIPGEAIYEHHLFSSRAIQSLAIFPLRRLGSVLGYLIAEVHETPRPWHPQTLAPLDALAGLLAAALARRAHERAMAAREQAAEHRAWRQAQLLSAFAHQLRAPLTAVLGYAEMVVMGVAGSVTERQSKYLGELLESGRNMADLISDALRLAAIEQGEKHLALTRVDIAELVRSAVRQVKPRARDRYVESDVPEHSEQVFADPELVTRLLIALLHQALQAAPPRSSVTIRLRVRADNYDLEVSPLAATSAEPPASSSDKPSSSEPLAGDIGDLRLALIERLAQLHEGTVMLVDDQPDNRALRTTLKRRPVPLS